MAKPQAKPMPPKVEEPKPPEKIHHDEYVGLGVAQLIKSDMRGWAAYAVSSTGQVQILTPERKGEYEDKFRALARARSAFIDKFARPEPRKLNTIR